MATRCYSPEMDVRDLQAALAKDKQDALVDFFGGRPRDHIIRAGMMLEGQSLGGLEMAAMGQEQHFRDMMVSLAKTWRKDIAKQVHDAISGVGTDDKALIDIFSSSSMGDVGLSTHSYEEKYHTTMEGDVAKDTSGDYKKTLLAIIRGTTGNTALAASLRAARTVEEHALALHASGEGRIGTNEDVFIELLTTYYQNSPEHIQGICAHYQKTYGHSLQTAIERETSGKFRDLLIALSLPRDVYVARRVHDAIQNSDKALIKRLCTLNPRDTLVSAGQLYATEHGDLTAALTTAFGSSSFGKLLCRLFQPL
ncbi:annexin A6 [Pelomyxa schiedti]|nr:annexin A6 [Pelomyxa schiedti]